MSKVNWTTANAVSEQIMRTWNLIDYLPEDSSVKALLEPEFQKLYNMYSDELWLEMFPGPEDEEIKISDIQFPKEEWVVTIKDADDNLVSTVTRESYYQAKEVYKSACEIFKKELYVTIANVKNPNDLEHFHYQHR